jgi:carbamoyltransferase
MLTLGINSAWHDSAVALVHDGEVLFAAEEERFSRVKHDSSFPRLALQAALDHEGVSLRELDGIAFGWNRPGLGEAYLLGSMLSGRIPPFRLRAFGGHVGLFARALYTLDGKRELDSDFDLDRVPVQFVDHHEAHAVSAYALSGFEESAVLVVDGHGAWQSTTIYDAQGDRLRRLKVFAYPNSLGSFYTAFTHLLGFESNSDEWKLMGLAAYGTPTYRLDEIITVTPNGYRVNPRALRVSPGGTQFLERRFGPRRDPEQGFTDDDRDLAASVQEVTEEAVLALVRVAVRLTGHRNLCLAGGVAMNSKANGKIIASGLVDRLFVQPAATDDGTAIGAALALQQRLRGRLPRGVMRHAYLGPAYSTDEIRRALEDARIPFVELPDLERVTARLLADGFVVGWFQGRMEFGPRALGSRSILGDPRDVQTRDRVNASVKFREEWRPFAPSCLAEDAAEYFEPDAESPFMILTFDVRAPKRSLIPAVTHVDRSARVQTVRRDVNARYWRLLKEFKELTGVPVVLNTSFNLKGEPIVCRPQDAIRTFFTSGLDFLAIGDFIVAKDDVRDVLEQATAQSARPVAAR